VAAVIGGTGNSAQTAIQGALLHAAGIALDKPDPSQSLPPNEFGLPAPARVAADRFSALPAAAQRAWLASHWTVLRAGHITLAQIP
jgi:hypothetical protein